MAKLLTAVTTGLVLGVAVMFLVSCAIVAAAWISGETVTIPGVLRAWFGEANDMAALSFQPGRDGMVAGVVVIAAIYFWTTSFTAVAVKDSRRP